MRFPFDNTYARLPDHFFARLEPTPVPAPGLIKVNRTLAQDLGLDPDFLESPAGAEILAGNRIAEGSEPIAQAYAGHQFGNWVPQLGDGRAILLGEVIDAEGRRRDIQLKGCGRTPFSRNGDGRAWLGPVLREYVVSEAMAALGVPTTRALAAVTTGQPVFREDALPGAVLTRVAASHVRVGTFQFFAARNDVFALRRLADYVIDRHDPAAGSAANPVLALLDGVVTRQATLIAKWMGVGFIHGVMNTDNMSISGETIDYGPCAFMDTYHPMTVFSSIDYMGRYAFKNQPEIAQWNLSCLASALAPVVGPDRDAALEAASDVLNRFPERFTQAWSEVFLAKIGLADTSGDDANADRALALGLLDRMKANHADFTLTFRRLSALGLEPSADDDRVRELFDDPAAFDAWARDWRTRLARDGRADSERQAAMRAVNPAYIPRNHRVEQMIAAAVAGDFSPFETLHGILSRPYDEQPEHAAYQNPPEPDEVVRETFCGT